MNAIFLCLPQKLMHSSQEILMFYHKNSNRRQELNLEILHSVTYCHRNSFDVILLQGNFLITET